MAKATSWPQMIRAVYNSFDTGRHTGDQMTRNIMDKAVSWLVKGLQLSPKLQAALVRNINQRTHFRVEEPADGIRLTREQIKYARTTNPEWFGYNLDTVDLNEEEERNEGGMRVESTTASQIIPPSFHDLSTLIQHLFHTYSTLFPHQAPVLAQQLVSLAAEKGGSGATSCSLKSSKDNERGEEQSNHEDMEFASQLDFHEAVIPPAISHVLPGHHDPLEHPIIEEVETHEQEKPAATYAPALTLWLKPGKRGKRTLADIEATGNLDIKGETFRLRFTAFDNALDRIPACNENQEWLRWMGREVASNVLPAERTRSGLAARSTMSALFGTNDWSGLKEPEIQEAAVLLDWNGDEPTHATIIAGDDIQTVSLKKENNNRYKAIIA